MTQIPSYKAFHPLTCYTLGRPPQIPPVAATPRQEAPGQFLPLVQENSRMTLLEALSERRSQRSFSGQALPLREVSGWLRASLGEVGDGLRAYPSAGALYPNHSYLVPLQVSDLNSGVYRYQPEHHALKLVSGDTSLLGQALHFASEPDLEKASAVLFITSRFEEAARKYGERAYRFALQESGHMMQNLLLVAQSLGWSALPLGSYLDDLTHSLLCLPEEEQIVYAVAVGLPGLQKLNPERDAKLLSRLHPQSQWLQWRLYTDEPLQALQQLREESMKPLQLSEEIRGFWYMLKSDGALHARLRVEMVDESLTPHLQQYLEEQFQHMLDSGALREVVPGVYEPEAGLFGGDEAMQVTHRLFETDSELALTLSRHPSGERHLVSHIWLELMLRSIHLDPFERWDVWRRVRSVRPGYHEKWEAALNRMRSIMEHVLTTESRDLREKLISCVPEGHTHLETLDHWAGRMMALNQQGMLERGLREIAAVCVIFHWNRMMFGPAEQPFLAYLRYTLSKPR
ncbi:thiopeptide-type bacteriocin biosynthesis protein [Deinococcus cellulosilyticus]|uniref:Nitroreductase domain-containing protein n=1 Tax=Deinococcus cellulosilyticus (strain DSM 18568 / NBRC 106333 / KACC 11606 / 5516J-15) TaxID=1223518 RepID=A0A511N3A3_DEIC1|nr:thiopeptide-type bacteriocin biosynthesis protein [Deinococcus cellulosilyticus]GEM46896.1 hypothetical protein DC3_25310 [Deinococcus cellulosilyticus NBRC 106333 = KACC 11606]